MTTPSDLTSPKSTCNGKLQAGAFDLFLLQELGRYVCIYMEDLM